MPNEQMVFLPSSIVPSSPGFLSFMWFTLFPIPNMPGVHYPRSPTFPSSPVGGGSQNRRSMKSRSELFEDGIVQLDSAAGEAREDGLEELATYIEETLIPFVKKRG
jgi:hypothetical protein